MLEYRELTKNEKKSFAIKYSLYIIIEFLIMVIVYTKLTNPIIESIAPALGMGETESTIRMCGVWLFCFVVVVFYVFVLALLIMNIQAIYDIIRNKVVLLFANDTHAIFLQLRYVKELGIDLGGENVHRKIDNFGED